MPSTLEPALPSSQGPVKAETLDLKLQEWVRAGGVGLRALGVDRNSSGTPSKIGWY